LFLRDQGETEVGGFGIASPDDLLRVEDIQLVRQICTSVSVRFDDESVADFFDRQVDAGRRPEQVGRLWIHTHPGSCPLPSATDKETFARVFGRTDYAVMFILARGGQTYARLEFHVGPGGWLLLPVHVDYTRPFPAANHAAWREEYLANVQEELACLPMLSRSHLEQGLGNSGLDGVPADDMGLWDDFLVDCIDGERVRFLLGDDQGGFLHDDNS
jgi:proteasome lid subunit RPN8/RPN11